MKKLACLLALLLLLTLVGCTEPRSPEVTVAKKPAASLPEPGASPLYLAEGGSSLHRDEGCIHLIDSEEIRLLPSDPDTVTTLLSIGYSPCEACFRGE